MECVEKFLKKKKKKKKKTFIKLYWYVQNEYIGLQVLQVYYTGVSQNFIGSDLSHNYLHTPM